MHIVILNEKYTIIDNDTVVMTADSKEELYSKAIQVLQAFEGPISNTVPTQEQTQQAIDLLTNIG
jgi:hypothetical protein|tara:strand:- start:715 stop:909 length:195 start_codon:yes stop_codon:yes gene_type:complete